MLGIKYKKLTVKNKMGGIQIILIVCMWLLIVLAPLISMDNENVIEWSRFSKLSQPIILLFIMFLINRFVLLPFFLFKGKRLLYGIGLVLLVSSHMLIISNIKSLENISDRNHQIEELSEKYPESVKEFRLHTNTRSKNHLHVNIKILMLAVLVIGFDTGLVFAGKWMRSEKNQAILEKENAENKMMFLRNQISPHFFMNTLNNIHAMMDSDIDLAKESVIRLSNLMSYMLYDSQNNNVSLKQELDFVDSYIDLMKLRFNEKVEVSLDFPSVIPAVSVPPLLTISFIENAFKHGISYKEPTYVHIKYKFEDEQLKFTCENKNLSQNKETKNSGVGLKNARNRLDIIYGSNYWLEVEESEERYVVKLNIPL